MTSNVRSCSERFSDLISQIAANAMLPVVSLRTLWQLRLNGAGGWVTRKVKDRVGEEMAQIWTQDCYTFGLNVHSTSRIHVPALIHNLRKPDRSLLARTGCDCIWRRYNTLTSNTTRKNLCLIICKYRYMQNHAPFLLLHVTYLPHMLVDILLNTTIFGLKNPLL